MNSDVHVSQAAVLVPEEVKEAIEAYKQKSKSQLTSGFIALFAAFFLLYLLPFPWSVMVNAIAIVYVFSIMRRLSRLNTEAKHPIRKYGEFLESKSSMWIRFAGSIIPDVLEYIPVEKDTDPDFKAIGEKFSELAVFLGEEGFNEEADSLKRFVSQVLPMCTGIEGKSTIMTYLVDLNIRLCSLAKEKLDYYYSPIND